MVVRICGTIRKEHSPQRSQSAIPNKTKNKTKANDSQPGYVPVTSSLNVDTAGGLKFGRPRTAGPKIQARGMELCISN